MTGSADPGARTVGYGDVLRNRIYRGLLAAEVLSLVGDRLAAVALTVLVYRETGSALLSGATYAATLLPWLVSGLALSVVADRFSRRTVMIGSDLVRAGLVGLMTLPGAPIWLLLALLALTSLLAPPFEAARAAVLPSVLRGEEYAVGMSLSMLVTMATQLAGLALAGAVVAQIGVPATLAVNAVSFIVSALLVAAVVPRGVGRVPVVTDGGPSSLRRDVLGGVSAVFGDARLRSLLLMAWLLASVLVVPEGLAVVLVEERGASAVWTGVLMAAVPAGMAVGAGVLGRVVRSAGRGRALLPLAALAVAPLVLTGLELPLAVLALLWFVAGLGGAYQMPANVLFMTLVPDSHRGRAFGLAQSGLLALQGVALLAAGAAADVVGVEAAVTGAAAVGAALVALLALRWPGRALVRAAEELTVAPRPGDVVGAVPGAPGGAA